MSRRRPPAELQFGSDSFLDVVANIVGILIILIVIAGLRVSQTPVVLPSGKPDPSEKVSPPVLSSMPEIVNLPEPKEEATTPQIVVLDPVVEAEPEPAPPPLPALVAPEDLVNLTNQLESEISAMNDEESKLAKKLKQSGLQKSTLLERQQAIQNILSEKTQELDASRRQAAKMEADLELLQQTLARLAKQVKEVETSPKNVEALEHRITPISRVVSGTEQHYRLEKNRVVEVPIEELSHRFREQLQRRKEWLVKTRRHEGEIGPIRGFTMHYLVQIETMSGLEAARAGYNGYSIKCVRWTAIPEPDVKGETEDAALRKGSQFYQSILGTSPDTTLTFWVYPDSYGIFRKLQKFAHEHGYAVAGRPLPHGMHIAGAPDGSKSASE